MSKNNQFIRVSYIPRSHRHRHRQQSKVKSGYTEEPSTNMNPSSRVSPWALSKQSAGPDSSSRNQLMMIQHSLSTGHAESPLAGQAEEKNPKQSSSASPRTIDMDEIKPKTEKSDVGVSKNKKRCPLTLGSALGIIAVALGLAAIGMSIYNLVATPKTTTSTTTTTIPTLRWNSTGVTVAGNGGMGTGASQFSSPFGLALDSSNTLYVSDLNNSRVQKWSPNSWTGVTVVGQANGAVGSTSSSLRVAGGLVIDSSGNIYVADIYNSRIQYWINGQTTGTTVAGVTSTSGTANNLLSYPYSLTRDSSSGTLYIADTVNQRVMRYLPGALSGTVVAGNNGMGYNNTQLNYPIGLYFDSSSNSLVIANAGANNIVRWVLGANSWTLIAGDLGGAMGITSTMFYHPTSVTFDYWGNMYVADAYNHRIQFFLPGQSSGTTIAGVSATSGSNATLLNTPYTVVLDADLNLYVSDGDNFRVQKFVRY